jgi:hypothetical protein
MILQAERQGSLWLWNIILVPFKMIEAMFSARLSHDRIRLARDVRAELTF